MLNQKGQAFSVFELMIAAIVAIAILMVLMNIMSGVGGDATGGAKDAIATGLSSNDTGGSANTQPFTLQKGALLTSKQFSDDGFDPQSIIFAVDKAVPAGSITAEINTDGETPFSFFKYNSGTSFKANARVICELTGTSLIETLESGGIIEELNDDMYDVSWPTDLCGEAGKDYEYTPCCLVIIQRSR